MKKLSIVAAFAAFLAPSSAFAADDVAESLSYRAFIGGLPLGTLQLNIAMDRERYATQVRFDMTSFLRLVLDTDARASSSGRLSDTGAQPQNFDYWLRDGKKTRDTQMTFDSAGNPAKVISDPPFAAKPYDMELDAARGALDPATAVAMLSIARPSACDVDMTVYDGRKLHRVSMQSDPNSRRGTEGPTCIGRYERLAGFKQKYMTDERRVHHFKAELVEIGQNRWRPRRVWAETKFGAAVAVLQ